MTHSPSRDRARRIAVISDVHGNSLALRAALEQARNTGFDDLVLLGDLLTYGCAPQEVIDLTGEAMDRHGAHLISGNHDQLYFDLAVGRTHYYDGLPAWLRETVDWTRETLADFDLEARFTWKSELALDEIFFAHANPFEYGDWAYLNAREDLVRARDALVQRGYPVGVFGHTHRPRVAVFSPTTGADCVIREVNDDIRMLFQPGPALGAVLANPGSVGQSRAGSKASTMMTLSAGDDALEIAFSRLEYDMEAHCRAIETSSMSEQTKLKLLGFFR